MVQIPPARLSTYARLVLTIPNLVSFARLLLIPYFWWVLLADERVGLAAALIFIIGTTDWVDGYLARRLDQMSRLGALLDPVADRLMIASALIAGLIAGVLPVWFGVLTIIREALVSLVSVIAYLQGRNPEVTSAGKVATFLIYGAVPCFYLTTAEIAPWLFGPPAWVCAVLGLVIYWYAAYQYVADWMRGAEPA